ncbi:MAG: precorrin-6A reductase [Treponema sp.]|nr:precorrin-6A reductase [Treponema sp.]
MTVFIFAGTTEGRELALLLSKNGVHCTVSVATEYGASLLPKAERITVLHGRLSHEEMAEKFSQNYYDFVIDATHPFATEVSKEIKKACNRTQNRYIRLARETAVSQGQKIFVFSDIVSAGTWLEGQGGKIFVTTGSKELPSLTAQISDKARLFVRVLPTVESIQMCAECGILQKQIIAMQGPFSETTNEIQFKESGTSILLTKESGTAGGFFEKITAAEKLGMKIAVIQNPEKRAKNVESEVRFSSVEALAHKILEKTK